MWIRDIIKLRNIIIIKNILKKNSNLLKWHNIKILFKQLNFILKQCKKEIYKA